jgi:ABC-type transporter Mla MlaB component
MKLLYQQEKYIQHSLRVARRAEKRRLARRVKIKIERRSKIGKSIFQLQEISRRKYTNTVVAPNIFLFLENQEQVIDFINKLDSFYEKGMSVYVDLQNVEIIDYGAITVLLSVMFMFKSKNIKFNGNFPLNLIAKSLLTESGFFESLEKTVQHRGKYTIGKENQICTQANTQVTSELGLPIMIASTKTIWGEERICRGLQKVLLELMHNTHNHAVANTKGVKHWWLSVNHDKENKKVSYVFVDYGVGIFNSLQHKSRDSKWYGFAEKVKSSFGYETNEKFFQLLLEGELHATVTGEKKRGKGLPSVKRTLDHQEISNLRVISNNVYANVSNTEYRLLNNSFKGTFFYWELCYNDKNELWTIK